jgi:AcrR family transcriptional regulator
MGTAERRRREKEIRRRRILRAAARLFSEGGWTVRVDAVAKKAEVAKGTVYLYFKNKEELYVGALADGLDILRDKLEAAAARHPDPRERLFALADAYLEFSQSHNEHFRLMAAMHHGALPDRVRPEVLSAVMEKGFACWQVVAKAIEDGQRKGLFGDWPPLPTAVVLWAGVTGAATVMAKHKPLEFVGLEGAELFRLMLRLLHAGLEGRP